MSEPTIPVLDHGFVKLRNIAGPMRRTATLYDADDTDPANAARMSFGQMNTGRTREEDLKLAKYLMKHRHTTPIEMIVVWVEMKMPIFVARQLVRHRTVSINEISGRYVQLPKEFYVPKPKHVGVKAVSNKQGRTIPQDWADANAKSFCERLNLVCQHSYSDYQEALDAGIPTELARCFLHLNHYTHWLWKQDLHNVMHMLSLRQDSHAQWETQQYASAVHELLSEYLPELMRLYDEFRRT